LFPRFQQENFVKNKVFYERIVVLASKHGCTPGQLALAWLLHQGDVVPIPGKKIAYSIFMVHKNSFDILNNYKSIPGFTVRDYQNHNPSLMEPS
jgi:hypothetical protein